MRRFSAVGIVTLGVMGSLCGCQGLLGNEGSSTPLGNQPGVATSSAADIEAGLTIAQSKGCSSCHSSAAGTFSGAASGIGGRPVFGPNLTPDMETGIGGWTDRDLITAIRFGIDDEGGTLCSEMPRYKDLSDTDAAKLVAYLRSLTPVKHETSESECTPSPADVALHGQRLVIDNGCTGCHGGELSGASGPNLTPDEATGIGSWSAAQIGTAVRTGVDDEGATLCSTMPRYLMLNDDELEALSTYLKSLPAVAHDVEVVCNDPEQPEPDAGNVEPMIDAGLTITTETVDAGLPVVDAGRPIDAGLPVIDAGTPVVDAGMPVVDAGIPVVDAGTCGGAEVVISEVYGAGGNAGALYKADFIEVHNRTNHTVSISGWSVQYASSAGSTWTVASIPAGTSLSAGAFALFAVSPVGTNGAALPVTAVTLSTLNLSATAGKIALTNSATALTGACPSSAALVDFVGYGATNCSEGSAPMAALNATTAATRRDPSLACTDSDVNASDFVAVAPAPHLAPASCNCP